MVSFRVPTDLAPRISALIASIKLGEARVRESDGNIMVEALEGRLRGLANRAPALVRMVLGKLQ